MNALPAVSRCLCLVFALGLVACGDSGGRSVASAPGGGSSSGGGGGVVTPTCTTKLPLEARDYVIEVPVASDFDRHYDSNQTALTPAVTPTTRIGYTVALPERCPGELFPLVLQSHGYSGTRTNKDMFENEAFYQDPATNETVHFEQINELVGTLPRKGYVVISYDERGHGASKPATGGGYARAIDPEAEVADARAILDWAWDNSIDGGNGGEKLPIRTDKNSGIAKDLRMGTIGLSYGGGFQLQLTALDDRIDTIVPNGTWHSLMYSLLPGDAVKNGFDGLLCVLALGTTGPQDPAVINTAVLATLCNLLGPTNVNANNIRTRADLVRAAADPMNPAVNGNVANQGQASRVSTEQEIVDLIEPHGPAFYKSRQQANLPIPGRTTPYRLRSIPALFVQGNRDVLFNLTEAYWNYLYFSQAAANADVRLLSTDGGHMNPFAGQVEGPAKCGTVDAIPAIYAWFDFHLKGISSATYTNTPRVCIAIGDTPTNNAAPVDAGVTLIDVPVGSLTGTGALPAVLATATAAVNPTHVDPNPLFLPVVSVTEADFVLAGIPSVDVIEVADGTPASPTTAVAYVGVGIRRTVNGMPRTILVDQEVTPFVKGTHNNNRNINQTDNTSVLLPGVGEKLLPGDQVGLVLYCANIHYQAVGSTAAASGVGGAGPSAPSQFPGATIPNATTCTNNYAVQFTNIQLPIFKPGTFPGSALTP